MKTKTETSAGGIVYKKFKIQNSKFKTEWLVCKHSYLHKWVFPKGLVGDKTSDEHMEQAALREVDEEGGVKARIVYPKPLVATYTYQWQGSPHGKKSVEKFLVYKTVHYFLMEYISGDPKNHDWEMEEAKFADQDEVMKLLSHESEKRVFKKAIQIFESLNKD